MSNNTRRPPTGHPRPTRSEATVVNATALSHSSHITPSASTDRLQDAGKSLDKYTTRPDPPGSPRVKDSLAKDPFVSISLAIHSARLRAGASLRNMPSSKHYARSATHRALSLFARRASRVLSISLAVLIAIFILAHRNNDNPYTSNASFWASLQQASTATPTSAGSGGAAGPSSGDRLRNPTSMFSFTPKAARHVIALIADLDRESCRIRDQRTQRSRPGPCIKANAWVSYLKRGLLTFDSSRAINNSASVQWLDEEELESVRLDGGPVHLAYSGGRGMELSDLCWFGKRLFTPDDRTGNLLELLSPKGKLPRNVVREPSQIPPTLVTRAVLRDGDGLKDKQPFKAEWMTVKDNQLIIGGHGRAYTDPQDGSVVISDGPKWVKIVGNDYSVQHENWSRQYAAVEKAAGVPFPGYLMHEAVLWSDLRREWLFLPRRRSASAFDSVENERRGWNGVITADEDFSSLKSLMIGGLFDHSGTKGFSAAKFVPGSLDKWVVALRTVELETSKAGNVSRETASFLSVFDIETGHMVLPELKVSAKKFEGMEFL